MHAGRTVDVDGRGVVTGDVDNDGLRDLVVTGDEAVSVYLGFDGEVCPG